MNSNIDENTNNHSKPVTRVRPKSSIFPPLVRQSPDQDFRIRRSSSFDYSFSNSKQDLYSNKSSNSPKNDVFVNQREEETSPSGSSKIIPLRPKSPIDECQRLKNENQVLKNNFLHMSRLIQKHSRLMAKKDEIILKLQEKNSRNYLPVIGNETQTISLSQNDSDHLSLPNQLSSETSEEIQTKNLEFSMKFRQIYNSMITDLSSHLTQFTKVIDEMQKFLENNLKRIERRNSSNSDNSEIETKLLAMNTDYSELRNNYEVLRKQNSDFKSFIQFVNNSLNFESVKDLTSSQSIESLRQHFTQLLTMNQSFSDEIKSIQNCRKTEEDYCFWLIESLSEVELELELLGRNPQTLSKVIEKLDQKLETIRQTLSQTYLESFNKTLLQIYKNHLKWFQFVNKPSKSTQTWVQHRADDSSTEDEEITIDSKHFNVQKSDNFVTEVNQTNEISEEIKSKFEEMSDEMSFDEFDIETINYILMAKHFDYNLKSNLEVVEEVEEENIEEEEEEESATLSYEDDVFEEAEECLKKSETSESVVKIESNVENIEKVVEHVLNDILDQISDQFLKNQSKESSIDKTIENNVKDMESSPSTSRCDQHIEEDPNKANVVEVKPPNIDSDFVSDDLSSSPETVMTYSENVNKQDKTIGKISSQFLTTFDELKQLKSRQLKEVDSDETRVHEMENFVKEGNNSIDSQKQSKESQYLSDELKAWKEMVEQQKAIMEKIRTELELQQKLNHEKDITIESLKNQSKSESLAEILENQTSVHQNSDKFVDESDDESKTLMDELELNNLFDDNSQSDSTEVEVIQDIDSGNQMNGFSESMDQKTPDILIQEVWDKKDEHIDRNYVSDESSGYSVYTNNSSPLSVPEEYLSSNRRKVFIPYSHEDAAVRRHSCQGRITHYGDHPRKKRLDLKNVEIVFQQQKAAKEVRQRIKGVNKK